MSFKRLVAMILTAALIVSGINVVQPAKKVEAAGEKLVAFTFDDGPSDNTSRLLDGLRARGAKATFFMNGTNGSHGTVRHMAEVRRMVAEGHQIANHTYSHHVPFSNLSSPEKQSEVARVNDYLYNAMGGAFQTIARIPGGEVSAGITANVACPMIRWNVDTLDWKYRNASTVYRNIMNNVSDGSVVLLHDLYNTSIDGALSAISDLQAQGYTCVTVSELFRRKGVSLENYTTYNSVAGRPTVLPAYSAPQINVSMDNYANMTVSVSALDEGITVRYTTDGSEPGFSSPEWPGTMSITRNMTIKVSGYDKFGTKTPTNSIDAVAGGYAGTFDARYYADRYPDLRQAFGYDATLLWNHYVNFGMREGRQGSAVFCLKDYKNKYEDLRAAFGDDNMAYLRHFATYGMSEARQGSSGFDVNSYRMTYPDLRQAFGNDLPRYYNHYMTHGVRERRTSTGASEFVGAVTTFEGVDYSPVYDFNYYIEKNPDVRAAYGMDDEMVLKHFIYYGMREGRKSSPKFDLKTYRDSYADLRAAFGNDNRKYYLHYLTHGIRERRKAVSYNVDGYVTVFDGVDYSAVYDYNYYISKYEDLREAFGNDDVKVLRHFVKYGMREGRQASAEFNLKAYRSRYEDLRKAFGNNNQAYYLHYIKHGKWERRNASDN